MLILSETERLRLSCLFAEELFGNDIWANDQQLLDYLLHRGEVSITKLRNGYRVSLAPKQGSKMACQARELRDAYLWLIKGLIEGEAPKKPVESSLIARFGRWLTNAGRL